MPSERIPQRNDIILERINSQLNALNQIVVNAASNHDYETARERLGRWKERTIMVLIENISQNEGEKLRRKIKSTYLMNQPLQNLKDEAAIYKSFLVSLSEEVSLHAEEFPEVTAGINDMSRLPEPKATSRTVFVVHGHDAENRLLLEKLLKERWGLKAVVLANEAGMGRTLIEKFEEEAKKSGFAFVLFTPDDVVLVEGKEQFQPRPNVIFELGWFYGQLGRERVCILYRRGANIHSDLDGISRIEFLDKITDKVLEIEKELIVAGLIERKNR